MKCQVVDKREVTVPITVFTHVFVRYANDGEEIDRELKVATPMGMMNWGSFMSMLYQLGCHHTTDSPEGWEKWFNREEELK